MPYMRKLILQTNHVALLFKNTKQIVNIPTFKKQQINK